MTKFLTFTGNQTPPSERPTISENDLPDQEFGDNHHSGKFNNKWLSNFNHVGEGHCEAWNNLIDLIPTQHWHQWFDELMLFSED